MYIAQNIIVEALTGHKGQFVGVTVDKKLKKGETVPEESTFNFKVCKENAPSYKEHTHLVSIKLANGRYKSFDTGRVKSIKINKTLIVVD